MASLRTFFGIGNKVTPTAPAAEPEGVKAPTAPAAPAPEVQLPPAKHAPAGGAQAQSVGAQAGQRGNFAAILSAQKAGAAVVESPASVGALTRGAPFPAEQAAALRKITGHPVTRAGLEQLYASVLPDTHVFISDVTVDRYSGSVELSVDWLDNDGDVVARLNRRLAKHQDGDLELYSHGCWVEPSHRSRAVSAAVMQREVELLSSLSAHPRTRLSLWAGGMKDPNNPSDFQPLGVYVWATMGFDCAQNHAGRSRLSRSGGKSRCDHELKNKDLQKKTDFELSKHMFEVWVDAAAERGELPRDPGALADLKRAAGLCKNMWSLATLDVPGLTVDVELGGRKSPCHVGKAFLLSAEAPRWEGVFLVHERGDDFGAIADAYCRPRMEEATATFDARQVALAKVLDGDDLAAKQAALADVGKSGDARWAPVLEHLLHELPELTADVQAALQRVTGARLTEALLEQAMDPGRSVKARLSALDRALDRAPERREGALAALIEAPRTGSDFEVAAAALNRLAHGRVEPQRLFGLLEGLYQRALDAVEVRDPVGAGYKSFFRVKTDTRAEVVGHLSKLATPAAQALLLEIVHKDPYWEVAAQALDAWAGVVGAREPDKALAEVSGFLGRARARHEALKPEAGGQDADAARRAKELQGRLSRVRNDVIATLAKVPAVGVADALVATMRAEPYYDGVGAALEGLGRAVGATDPARVIQEAERWYKSATNYAPMRERAAKVLSRLPEGQGHPSLVRLAQTEQDRYTLYALQDGLRDSKTPGAADALARIDQRLAALDAAAKAKQAPRAS
jgi:hypothetical protein